MKILVVNGTSVRGITYHMKEMFLAQLGEGSEVVEFYPDDMPPFCLGCKNCFLRGEEYCPHREKMQPIWSAFLVADVLVFAYPVYALRAPASVKSLLDHLCVHWTVHRPEPEVFEKTAVILTNSVGAPNGSAQKDVKTSMSWMGVSNIYTCGARMMGDIFWDKLSDKHRRMLEKKTAKLAGKVRGVKPRRHMSLKVSGIFAMNKMLHQSALNGEDEVSLDNQHYLKHGWIKPKKKNG